MTGCIRGFLRDNAAMPARPAVLQSLEFLPGVVFDARRAIYLREERVLAVADLHLGYAWSHRMNGQMLPLAKDDTLGRLAELLDYYKPAKLVLLGDIVHSAAPAPALIEELKALVAMAEGRTELVLLAGNHDRKLQEFLGKIGLAHPLIDEFRAGQNLLLHGDRKPSDKARRYIIGHEHPAIAIGDGVTTSRKFPCFLISEDVLTLPSFSSWSAHTPYAACEFMSPLARGARFQTALAILGDRLLPAPLRS